MPKGAVLCLSKTVLSPIKKEKAESFAQPYKNRQQSRFFINLEENYREQKRLLIMASEELRLLKEKNSLVTNTIRISLVAYLKCKKMQM